MMPVLPITKTALLAGSLDIVAALVYYFLLTSNNPLNVLKYIASGIFGTAAFSGGALMMLAGLALHYLIAFTFTYFFFWIFPGLKMFANNRILHAIVYGLFVWAMMNLVVVPLSRVPQGTFNPVHAFINAVILIICIGLPVSFMAHSYYDKAGKADG